MPTALGIDRSTVMAGLRPGATPFFERLCAGMTNHQLGPLIFTWKHVGW
jgi:hypothetical protein